MAPGVPLGMGGDPEPCTEDTATNIIPCLGQWGRQRLEAPHPGHRGQFVFGDAARLLGQPETLHPCNTSVLCDLRHDTGRLWGGVAPAMLVWASRLAVLEWVGSSACSGR